MYGKAINRHHVSFYTKHSWSNCQIVLPVLLLILVLRIRCSSATLVGVKEITGI
jgi:hypothetical protein